MPRYSTDCGPSSRSDNRANSCAAQRVLRRCLATRYATDLLFGKLPAQDIVDLKLIEGLARSRQHGHVRTDRHRGAGTKECQHREKYRPFLTRVSSPPIVVVATTDCLPPSARALADVWKIAQGSVALVPVRLRGGPAGHRPAVRGPRPPVDTHRVSGGHHRQDQLGDDGDRQPPWRPWRRHAWAGKTLTKSSTLSVNAICVYLRIVPPSD